MPSQPDYERAATLNPKKFETDPTKRLRESQLLIDYLADELASAKKVSRSKILGDAIVAIGSGKLPDRVEEKGTERAETQKVERNRALFFAHKERATYHPIDMLEQSPFSLISEANLKFFENAEEAEANGFIPAEVRDIDEDEPDEEDETDDEEEESDEEDSESEEDEDLVDEKPKQKTGLFGRNK